MSTLPLRRRLLALAVLSPRRLEYVALSTVLIVTVFVAMHAFFGQIGAWSEATQASAFGVQNFQ